MAEEAPTSVPVVPSTPAATVEPIEPAHADGATTEISKEDEDIAGKQATTEVTAPDGQGTTEVADPPSAVVADDNSAATPASAGKKEKRKSVGGVPEHKNKKLNKKKSMPTLHLECKPGDLYWARLKGYPPWPSIICDEQMLPESLLASRPVSTSRPDGSIRDDFKEGGKNARDRTFPVMFLATNEFTWMLNTSLTPLDPEECKQQPSSKMTKALQEAWKIASEGHDIDYFKGILKTWQEEQAAIEKEYAERAEKEAELAEERARIEAEEATNKAAEDASGKKKSKSRKSKGGEGDVEMEDADTPKSTKKRKKDGESDGDKPKKTPKVTKLNAPKTPNGESATKAMSASKSKKKIVQAPKDEAEEEKPAMTEAEKFAQREKAVLYLRHRLQKGFLTRDTQPKQEEMPGMADFFSQLESYENLEPAIIRNTKVHKVLKGIVKLSSIPQDKEYNFKKRSAAMLEAWNRRMEADSTAVPPELSSAVDEKPATNGEKVVEPALAAGLESTADGDAKDGATQEGEIKAAEAAEEIDDKVGSAPPEDKTDVVMSELPAAPAEAMDLGNHARDEATDGEAKTEAATSDPVVGSG